MLGPRGKISNTWKPGCGDLNAEILGLARDCAKSVLRAGEASGARVGARVS